MRRGAVSTPLKRGDNEIPSQAPEEFCRASVVAASSKQNLNSRTCWLVWQPVCALSSVVEHYLHTVGVAGSKPAARTIFPLRKLAPRSPDCDKGPAAHSPESETAK